MDSIAVEYAGGAAIFAGYVANATIRHNTISNTGYTGISLGWGKGSVFFFLIVGGFLTFFFFFFFSFFCLCVCLKVGVHM
jgi:hypothetical protein